MICPRCKKNIPDDALVCCYCARVIVRQKKYHKRRGNGFGCAYKRGDTWTAVITVKSYTDEIGRHHQIRKTKGGFKTYTEAIDYCAKLKQNIKPTKTTTLTTYWNLYSKGELSRLSRSKQDAYRIAWKRCSDLAYVPITNITIRDLRELVERKTSTYYPARDMKVLLGHLFDLAAADRVVDKDLPDFILLPPLEEKERQPFSKDEQQALWRIYESGDRRAAIPLIMIYTGMMPGEIQELKISMVNLSEQRIVGVGLKTKVRKASPVYLPDAIVPVLEDEISHSTSKEGYVWVHNEDKFYENYYAALSAAGTRRLEPYCCRHTTATALAITENIAPQTVQKVMRWSTTKMLLPL